MTADCYCDYDSPSFYSQVMRKARKRHRCDECRGEIIPGQKYEHASGLWDGDLLDFKTCLSCKDLVTWTKNNVPCLCLVHGEMIEKCKEAIVDAQYRAPDETKGLYFAFLRRLFRLKRMRAATV